MNARFDTVSFVTVTPCNALIFPFQANHACMFTFRAMEDLPAMTWCLRFDATSFAEWKDNFTKHMWEGKNRTSYVKVKPEEQKYIQDAYGDIEMQEDPEHRVEAREEEDELSDEDDSLDDPNGDQSSDEGQAGPSHAFGKGSRNQQLTVGYKDDLSYVTRGDKVGVFGQKNDKIKFRTTIDGLKSLQGKSFAPAKVSCRQSSPWLTSRSCYTTRIETCYSWIHHTRIPSCAWTLNMAKS